MKKGVSFLLLCALVVAGCNFAGPRQRRTFSTSVADAKPATAVPMAVPPMQTDVPASLVPSATSILTLPVGGKPQPSATSVIFPVLTLATDVVCRTGPAPRYYAVLRLSKGTSFEASGRNADGSWVAIQANRIGDDCWVPASSLEVPDDPMGGQGLSALNVAETQALPGRPISLTASDHACGVVKHLWLYWGNVDAIGYRIYRNGKEIASVYGGKYRDLDTPRTKLPTVFLYEVEAFNASGISERAGIAVTICG